MIPFHRTRILKANPIAVCLRVAASCTWVLAAALSASQLPNCLTVTLTSPQEDWGAAEPIALDWTLQSACSEAVRLDFGAQGVQKLTVVVKDETGREKTFPSPETMAIAETEVVSLAPGEIHRGRLLLTAWTGVLPAGEYNVELRLNPTLTGFPSATHERSLVGRLMLRVLPREEARLRATAARLAAAAQDQANLPSARRAAAALRQMRDPVAVPFLAELLDAGVAVQDLAAQGLADIGNAEAASELLSRLHSKDEWLAGVCASGLRRIARHTSDPVLKMRIERALGE